MVRAAPLEHPTALVGSLFSGGYRIVRLLDDDGYGVVFEAERPTGGRVALKVLRPEVVTEDTLSRLSREASITSKIDNRHIVPILDAGHDLERDLAYLVMPLLEGTDVAAMLARTGPLAPDVAVRIALQAAAGLGAGHAAGIVYRDIRPSRLFLAQQEGGELTVRVLGFGLSKGYDVVTAQPGKAQNSWQRKGVGAGGGDRRPGTPNVDQADSGPNDGAVDVRCDVFGLAATLYQMLSGALPWDELDVTPDTAAFGPEDTGGEADHASSAQLPSIQDRAPWVHARLATALSLALHSDVDRRYPSIEAFAEALRALGGSDERISSEMLTPIDPALRDSVAERADAETDPLIGRELGGRYAVRRLLGRGGMGAVYEAESRDGRRVAAKVIFKSAVGQDDQAVRRFIREARAVTAIQSPHVVKTFELGTDLTLATPFIVMELLSGIDLGKLLRMRGPLEPQPVVRVFIQAARGLAAAHDVGIVHRDIKPANLFLHAGSDGAAQPSRPSSVRPPPSSERKLVVKVCDFGIAKRADDHTSHEITRAGGVVGSPIYMSPEQAKRAKDVDRRSDVWSLSISLYQALCGSCPWDANASLAELLLAICSERVPPLIDAAPWLDPALAEVVHRGLSKDPDGRWQSMVEMIAALEPHAGGSDAVTIEQLRGVDAERRALAMPMSKLRRSSRPAAIGEGQERSIDGSAFPADEPPRSTSRLRVVGAAATLAALAALGGVIALRSPRLGDDEHSTGSGSAGSEVPSATRDQVARFTATVSVPPDVTVSVDGVPRQVADGRLALTGAPGDLFQIEVIRGGATQRERVFMRSDGKAHPDRIDFPPAHEPAASAGAPQLPASKPIRQRRPTGQPSQGQVTSTPPAAQPSPGVMPVDRW